MLLHAAADAGVEGGQFALAAGAFHDLARLGEPAEAAEHLERIAEHVDGRLMRRGLRRDGPHQSDAPGLDEASEAFEDIGGWLYVAEAATQASTLYDREGSGAARRRRRNAPERSPNGAKVRGAPPSRPLRSLSRSPSASGEVATLAARGLTSREIAGTIVVSTRTVENHLQRAYEKLGVRGRAELAEALGD